MDTVQLSEVHRRPQKLKYKEKISLKEEKKLSSLIVPEDGCYLQ